MHCDARFEAVRDAFAENFATRGEVGAAVCVVVDGVTVVDLSDGHADGAGRRPWTPDTLVNVFSVGKALAALCVARLVGEGRLQLDAPVARYWPEFAAAGKERLTVRQLLSHQGGLPAVARRLPPGAMLEWDVMTGALAEQEPWWEPGTAHGYHTNTFGFLVGELVRRVDGRSLGTALRDDVAGPLGADVSVGVAAGDDGRVAECLWPGPAPPEEEPDDAEGDVLMRYNTYFNPSGLSGAGLVNTPGWRRAEMPSTNSHASARGVTRIYEALAAGGTLDGVTVVDGGALAEATTEHSVGDDRILERATRFGLGFQLTHPERPLGPNAGAFGHFGVGGSLGFADPEAGVAFGYVMNQVGMGWQSPRNRALIDAVYASLSG